MVSGLKRVTLITGGGSGIGRAAALALAGAGHSVFIAGRKQESLNQTVELAKRTGADVRAQSADVSDPVSVAQLFDAVVGAFGRLDVLFNNAGVFGPAIPMEDLPLDDWNQVVNTNLTGVFLCSQHAVRIMKAQKPMGGRIINNGSISAHVPRPMSAAYTATKHAMTGLTKTIALDGRAHDIACSQIDIGNAATVMTDAFERGVLQPDGHVAPEARISLDVVAEALVYIANLPLEANVLFMTLHATKMPFVGRG